MRTAKLLDKIADYIAEFGYHDDFQWRCGMSDMLYILDEETLANFMLHFNDSGMRPVCTVNGKDFYKC